MMKPTSALLIIIAAFVVNPCAGSLAVAQSPKIPTAAQAAAVNGWQDPRLDGGRGRMRVL